MTTTEVDYSIHSSKLLKYQIVGYLGEGSYARVYKVRNDAWKYYALKAINPDMFEDFDKLEETYKRMKEFSEKYPDAPVVKVIEYDKTTTDLYNTFIEVVLHPVTDYSLSLIQEEARFFVYNYFNNFVAKYPIHAVTLEKTKKRCLKLKKPVTRDVKIRKLSRSKEIVICYDNGPVVRYKIIDNDPHIVEKLQKIHIEKPERLGIDENYVYIHSKDYIYKHDKGVGAIIRVDNENKQDVFINDSNCINTPSIARCTSTAKKAEKFQKVLNLMNIGFLKGMALASDYTLWVCCKDSCKLLKIGLDGECLDSFSDTKNKMVNGPHSVVVAENQDIIVNSQNIDSIQRFSKKSGKWDNVKTKVDKNCDFRGLDYCNGNVYVADFINNCVHVFKF